MKARDQARKVRGLRVIDVSVPTAPREVGALDTSSYACSVAVSGSYVYVADDYDGMRVIEVSEPSAPREVGSVYAYQSPGVSTSFVRRPPRRVAINASAISSMAARFFGLRRRRKPVIASSTNFRIFKC